MVSNSKHKLRVEWFNSATDIPDGLWADCFTAPYEGRWWYLALEQAHLEDQFTFTYGVVYEVGLSGAADKAIAIAPAFIMNVPISLVVPPALLPVVNVLGKVLPSLLYQRTFFIGSPCSDEGRVGMLASANPVDVLQAVNQAMQTYAKAIKAPMRVWKDFSNQYQAAFTSWYKAAGLFKLISFPGTEVKLEGKGFEGYLSTLKASRRNKLKKKLKQAALAPVMVEVIQKPSAETMDEIFALFWQTYEKGNTKFERLNRTFFELLSAFEETYYVVLREQTSQKMLSFMLCFKLGEHVINKFIGIDYSQPKEWFLYFRLWEAAVAWSYEVGASSIQSGQTGYAPKIELGNDMVALTNYCRHQNPIVHWVYAAVAKTVNWETLDDDLAVYAKAYPEHVPHSWFIEPMRDLSLTNPLASKYTNLM